eukprot:CAMPEP_0184719178 /NCGR_PEP_ID=MMETSP0314-20130426/8171_1 /TAXON_ID=38298 /ORGANISM="Rhodella maculata, Strain CCMP 736" /LENGTH=114 /DNA_ID=CAMNT_0027183031 /DNA_START=282 /DNA_END=628 /DNA_ORIENTATION=+
MSEPLRNQNYLVSVENHSPSAQPEQHKTAAKLQLPSRTPHVEGGLFHSGSGVAGRLDSVRGGGDRGPVGGYGGSPVVEDVPKVPPVVLLRLRRSGSSFVGVFKEKIQAKRRLEE